MPYFVSNDNPNCNGWAVEKDDGEVIGCHRTRRDAVEQMVAVSIAEGIEPGGVRSVKQLTADDFVAPDGAREEARRGLEWRREYGRGGTAVGVARARDIANGRQLSIDTIKRMLSYFARHEVDKQGEGWSPDEDGYPSAGRIAWALWGGDPGWSWARRVNEAYEREQENTRTSGTSKGMNVKRMSSSATFQVKAAASDAAPGEVTALVSVFNNTDLVGDRVMPGAFEKSLARYAELGKSIPFVWSHKWDDPDAYIGKVVEAAETNEGLVVRAELFDTASAKHIKTLLKEGVVTEFSFAYDVIDQAPGKDGVNELKELHILEAGPTLKGANPATQLVGVRSLAAASKAEPGELEVGDFVEWADGYGRVEYIMTDGYFGVDDDPMSLEANPDDPLAMVREYEEGDNGYEPTEIFTGHRFSELTKVDEKAQPADLDKPQSHGTGEKAGRVLSSKNENRIKDAVSLLNEVLGTLSADSETSKAEEPNRVKAEVEVTAPETPVMDAATAQLLLELETESE